MSVDTESQWLSLGSLTSYPLIGSVPIGVTEMLCDILISCPNELAGPEGVDTARLTRFRVINNGFGNVLPVLDLLLGNGSTVSTSSATTGGSSAWNGFFVIQWNFVNLLTIRAVFSSVAMTTYGIGYDQSMSAPIVARGWDVRPKANRLYVSDKSSVIELPGDVAFIGGYQSDVSINDTGHIVIDQNISVRRERFCPPAQTMLRSINGTTADSRGSILIDTDECLRLDRPQLPLGVPNNPFDATLVIQNQCDPCVDTDDVVNLYNLMRNLYTRLATVQSRLVAGVNQYDSFLRLAELVKSHLDEPKLIFRLFPGGGNFFNHLIVIQTGTKRFKSFSFRISLSNSKSYQYIRFSGREKLPGTYIKQNETLFSPTAGTNFLRTHDFKPTTASSWGFAVKVVNPPITGTELVDVVLQVTGIEVLPNGSLGSFNFPDMRRTITLEKIT